MLHLVHCTDLTTPYSTELMQEDVIVVDLDGGTLTVPESVTLYSFPQDILRPLREALKRVCSVGYCHLRPCFTHGY